ncbi:MAG TPA: hypothetical protein VK797_11325 [Tepidisphaeraceae bacterium]|nr:hypothetical protein [Tepidisphaeraceae bacterium]
MQSMISFLSRATHVEVLGVLLLALASSSATFWALVRRWTTQRQLVALIEWGKNAGFRVAPAAQRRLVPPLAVLQSHAARIETQLTNQTTTIVRLWCDSPAPVQPRQQVVEVSWNLLARRVETDWKAAGLRPTDAPRSVLDYFSLSSFSTIGEIERFVLYAADSAAAGEFPDSTARSLLPPDIGLLLYGHWLVLEFSRRPFDDLEFNRLIALAAQLELKLTRGQN